MATNYHSPPKKRPIFNLKQSTQDEILKPTHFFKGSRSLHSSKRPPSIDTSNLKSEVTSQIEAHDIEEILRTPETISIDKLPPKYDSDIQN